MCSLGREGPESLRAKIKFRRQSSLNKREQVEQVSFSLLECKNLHGKVSCTGSRHRQQGEACSVSWGWCPDPVPVLSPDPGEEGEWTCKWWAGMGEGVPPSHNVVCRGR